MPKPLRLDAELVRRGLAGSRGAARDAIDKGLVKIGGIVASKAATMVTPQESITVGRAARRYVSRGGDKLDGALNRLDVEVAGRRWLDAGASTGGFTDRLLKGGAAAVIAVDVGYGQFDWELRNDERVWLLERTNVRALTNADLPWSPDGVVCDLSFISITLVLPALTSVATPDADFLLMVKPQFEVGREHVGGKGVVHDPQLWRSSVRSVVSAAREQSLNLAGATASDLPGPAGNREFFLHLRRDAQGDESLIDMAVSEALR